MTRVLMFGWEFAPLYSGGLGVACAGMVRGMVEQGADVTFVLPRLPQKVKMKGVKVLPAMKGKVKLKEVPSMLVPYSTTQQYEQKYKAWQKKNPKADQLYGANLFEEVARYAESAKKIAREVPHDFIHCHDWMTYQAGLNAKKVSGKPLVMHIHATEFDRTGGNGLNPRVFELEKLGFEGADAVVAVSNFTKNIVTSKYGINPEKIEVAHNAVEFTEPPKERQMLSKNDKIVLFLGRITVQKGPDWFLYAAKKVLQKAPNVKFIMAGSGDMETQVIEKAAELGIAKNVLFTGFLTGEDIDKAYKMADVYVMPSVSEPFGITPLEAMRNGTPVIISKQSGVSEVIKHCLKVDFWDTDALADKMLGVILHKELSYELGERGSKEVHKFSWNKPAHEILSLYGVLKEKSRKVKKKSAKKKATYKKTKKKPQKRRKKR